ncbi:MAG: CFI-box-CTERM domain-containing protein [Candidatus Brocadiia bacterium]
MFKNAVVGFSLVVAALLGFTRSANAASSWDVSEKWDSGYSNGQAIYSYSTPWSSYTTYSGYPMYNSRSADVDSYYYSSSSYAAHIGCPYGYYMYTGFYDCYLIYTWSSPTLAAGTLTFWYYVRYSSLDVQYTTDGSTWYTAATQANYYSYVYGANTSVTIPAGARAIRFHSYAYLYYYYYGVWIDNVKYVMPWIDVNSISGYNSTDINAGVLSLTANVTSVLTGVDFVEWQYRKSTDTLWSDATTDNTPEDGFTCALDTSGITDNAFQVQARGYDDGNYGEWAGTTMQVQNFASVALSSPDVGGGDTAMTLSYVRTLVDVWHPANQWTHTRLYSTSSNYSAVDVSKPIPYSGTATKVQTNFSYTYSSSYNNWALKLYSGSAGSFTEVASSNTITAEIGLKEYDLSSTTFSNLSKNLLLGIYGGRWMMYDPSGYFTGNTQSCYYKSSTTWYGPYTTYKVPLRIKMSSYGADVDQVSFQYRADGGPWISLGNSQIVKIASLDKFAINWASWAVDSDEVEFRARFHYGPVWSGTYTFGPYAVHNRIDLTYNIAKSPGAPGMLNPVSDTELTIDALPRTVPYSADTTYYGAFTIDAPQYISDIDGTQWRFDYWSDGGAMSHEMQVLPRMNTVITAFYARQTYFGVDSYVSDFVAPPAGYYEPGTLIQVQVPKYSYVSSDTRYLFVSMEMPTLNVTTTEKWYTFNLTARTIVTLNWQLEYYFAVQNDKGVGTGTANGWYSEGTAVSYSVASTLDNGAGARLDNRGYNLNGAFGAASGSYSAPLSCPIVIQWIWQQQYNVLISSNVGTSIPASGWYDAGTTLSLNSIVPGSTSTVSTVFNGWSGTGTGAVTTAGGSPAIQMTVNGCITEVGTWSVSYKLDLIAVNGLGGFMPDATGWYPAGAMVTINIVSPSATSGSRYIPQWIGEGNGALSSIAAPDVPASVTVKMDNPIKESVQWHLQHSLTIENPDGFGTQNPAVGTYWLFNGSRASGVCQYIVGDKLCDGYFGSGSTVSGSKPYFSCFITAPSLVRWVWKDKPPIGEQSWNTSDLIVSVGSPSHMAASRDTSGHPVVAYYDAEAKAIMIAVKGDSSWAVSTLCDGVDNLDWLDLYVDSANNPHVTYYAISDRILHYVGAFEEAKTDSLTGLADVIQTDGDSGRNPHIAVNTMGDVFIAFYDMSENALKVASRAHDETIWTEETVDSEGNPGLFNAIAIREIDGMPVIAYHSLTLRRLMYAESTEGGWQLSVVDSDGDQGFYPSLALTPDGVPMIAYQDGTDGNNLHLKFATRSGGQWFTVLVDSTAGCGFNTSIAVDPIGVIHIGHHNLGNLRYARYDGASWELSSLGGNRVIGDTAVVLGSNDYPQVVYLDEGKIATVAAKGGASGGDDGDGGDGDGTTPTTSGGGGGCFVATAAFGTLSASEVNALTSCRDAVVAGSGSGSALVRGYYAVAPSAADPLRSSSAIRAVVRSLLD